MLKEVLYLIILLLAIPTGLLLGWLCSDEIKNWRKRLIIGIVSCLLLIIILGLIDFQDKIPVLLGLGFIVITSLTIYIKH